MFDTEITFEELPLMIGTTRAVLVSGTAQVTGDEDYGFVVDSVIIEDAYMGVNNVSIYEKHDDAFCVELFRKIAAELQSDMGARSQYFEKRDAECDDMQPAISPVSEYGTHNVYAGRVF